MFKHHKPDIQVLAALTAAIAATKAWAEVQPLLVSFTKEYQQGKVSPIGIGVFSRRISHVIYTRDYQVPTELLTLLSLLNQSSTPADPSWS